MSGSNAAAKPQLTMVGGEQTAKEAHKKASARSGPKWEQDAKDRVKAAIKKFGKPLGDLTARDANEGDTRLLVTDFLCDGLGYDKYEDLTTEYQVKGEYADYGIRIDKQLIAFIEVKRATTRLDVKHLRQLEMYAVNEPVEWAFLTNGAQWKLYHFSSVVPVAVDLALEADLLSGESLPQKTNQMFYFTKEALKRRAIEDVWKAKRATSVDSIAQVIAAPSVIDAIRKELKRQTGHSIETEEVMSILRATVLRPECFQK